MQYLTANLESVRDAAAAKRGRRERTEVRDRGRAEAGAADCVLYKFARAIQV